MWSWLLISHIVEQAEQRLNNELELRALTVGAHSPALLKTMGLLLKLYQVWHADIPAATLVKSERLIDRMMEIADTDETQFSWVYINCGLFLRQTGKVTTPKPSFCMIEHCGCRGSARGATSSGSGITHQSGRFVQRSR